MTVLSEKAQQKIRRAEPMGKHDDPQVFAYYTRGGTYIIASHALWNDDDKPKDLIAINRYGNLIQLSPTVSPELVAEVEELAR